MRILVSHANFSFTEVYNFPIQIREFYLRDFLEEKQKEKEAIKKNSKGGK